VNYSGLGLGHQYSPPQRHRQCGLAGVFLTDGISLYARGATAKLLRVMIPGIQAFTLPIAAMLVFRPALCPGLGFVLSDGVNTGLVRAFNARRFWKLQGQLVLLAILIFVLFVAGGVVLGIISQSPR